MKVCVKKYAPRDVRPLKDHIKQIFACYFLLVNFVSVSNMEIAKEGIEVNPAGGPVEQPWTERRVLEQLQKGVNSALNNFATADPVTIANFGVKSLVPKVGCNEIVSRKERSLVRLGIKEMSGRKSFNFALRL